MGLTLRVIEKIFEKSKNKLDYYQDPDRIYIKIIELVPGISLSDFNCTLKGYGLKELGTKIN